jgi:hypothetical protein
VNYFKEQDMEYLEDAYNTVSDTATGVYNTVSDAASAAGEWLGDAFDADHDGHAWDDVAGAGLAVGGAAIGAVVGAGPGGAAVGAGIGAMGAPIANKAVDDIFYGGDDEE